MTETTHPAVLASIHSAKFASAGDKQSWLSLFADDAFLADPAAGRHVRHRGVLPHTADNAATDAAAAVAADLHHRLQAELRSASDTSG